MATLLDDVRGLTATLVGAQMAGRTETELVDLLAETERLKSALTAVQADCAVALDHAVRARETEQGVIAARRGRGVGAQVALARQESPHRGQVLLGLARELATALPHTRRALREGRLNEFRAMIVARETGCLDEERRAQIDEAVCGDAELLAGLGTRRLAGELRRRVAAADPAAVVRRHARAVSERAVSVRPAPDGMAYLTAMLPLTQAVACYAGLRREADALRATGDTRGRGQAMADLLVERVTGQAHADQVPIAVTLVMSDDALLGAGTEPAVVPGHGLVPAQIAREGIARASSSLQAWIRRLYADPPAISWPSRASSAWPPTVSPPTSRLATRACAALRGATPPCATSTTSSRTVTAAPPVPPISKGSPKPAITRSRRPTGGSARSLTTPSSRITVTPWRPRRRRDTDIDPARPHHQVQPAADDRRWRSATCHPA